MEGGRQKNTGSFSLAGREQCEILYLKKELADLDSFWNDMTSLLEF